MTDPTPSCYHDVGKSEGEELIINGVNAEGDAHILRPKDGQTEEMILSLMYKGAPTHHIVSRNGEGLWTINKKTFGEHTNLNDLLAELAVPGVKGWPIPLVNPINNTTSSGVSGADVIDAEPAAPTAADTMGHDAATAATEDNIDEGAVDAQEEADECAEIDETPAESIEDPTAPPDVVTEDSGTTAGPGAGIKINAPSVEPALAPAPVAKKKSSKRFSRAEKKALMEKEEQEREARLKELLASPVRTDPTKLLPAKDDERFVGFAAERAQKKRDEDIARQQLEEKIASNKTKWLEEAKARRKSREDAEAKSAVEPKKLTKVELLLKKREEDEADAAAVAARIAKEQAKTEAAIKERRELSSKKAAEMQAKREAMEAEALSALPKWKRDKILKERAAEKAHREKIEADRAQRLQELRESRSAEEQQRAEEREAQAKRAKDDARRQAREAEKAAAKEAAELKKLQARLAKA